MICFFIITGELRNNTGFRFLLDQLSNGQLQWANVVDDFDTVILVDDDEKGQKGLEAINSAVEKKVEIPSERISFMSSQEETIKSLLKAFPKEGKAINDYFNLLSKFRMSMLGFVGLKAMPSWVGKLLVKTGLVHFYTNYFSDFASKSVSQTISEITKNDRLRAVLSYNFGDYGTFPGDAPFAMHASLQNHFLKVL